ncbi:MICOS complex subunit mic10 [Beauveria bassiana]|nr:MICOS complex subunit mic10 [Beauveria bassiana]
MQHRRRNALSIANAKLRKCSCSWKTAPHESPKKRNFCHHSRPRVEIGSPHRPRVWTPKGLPAASRQFGVQSRHRTKLESSHCAIFAELNCISYRSSFTMAESNTAAPAPSSAISRPWDRCLSNLLVKSSIGLGFGVVFSVILFRRRAWPAFIGAGFGAGRAYEECNFNLKQAARDLKKST